MEVRLKAWEQPYGLVEGENRLGLECTDAGLTLAGAPLLRMTAGGLSPKPSPEVCLLLMAAYNREFDARAVTAGLTVVANALNKGELGRAMIAAIRLRLAELDPEDAQHLRKAQMALSKYDEGELRDNRGWWTTGDEDEGPSSAPDPMKPIQVATLPAPANSNVRGQACINAGRHCVVMALQDTTRDKASQSRYFSACQEAEGVCLSFLSTSREMPQQEYNILFPDHTVVGLQNGVSSLLYISGMRLKTPVS